MARRETIWPLATAAAVSLLLHAVLIGLGLPWLNQPALRPANASSIASAAKPVLPQPTPLGNDTPRPAAVAWIDHQDFQELIAPQGLTHQPALQMQADPVERAPIEADPTPRVASAEPAKGLPTEALEPTDSMDDAQVADASASQASQALEEAGYPFADQPRLDVSELILGGRTTQIKPSPTPKPAPSHRPTHQKQDVLQSGDPLTPKPARHRSNPARPTAAARSDRESIPVKLHSDTNSVVPGGVLVGEGIRIKTALPRFSVVTRVSAVPHNPIAKILFNPQDGHVIEAKLIRSSGYPNVDGPVLASLYKWRASGQRLADLGHVFEMQVELRLAPTTPGH